MAKFSFEIDIEARTEQEAQEKLEAFINLSSSLEHEDLVECCEFVETHPNTVKYAKDMLPQLSGDQNILLIAPKLIKGINEAMEQDKAEYGDED